MQKIWWILFAILLAAAAPARAETFPTLTPDDMVLGSADAPVTIFEYASLTCPHCAEFDVQILPKIKTEWIETGKAKLIFRDYPLDQPAVKAAMLAHCAPAVRYFGFIDELFQTQQAWVLTPDPTQALSRIARLGGVGPEKFDACMQDKAVQEKVLNSRLVAQNQYGVNSTPTFFINGTKVVGALAYDEFAKSLSAALAKAPAAPRSTLPGPRLSQTAPQSTSE